MRNVAPMDGAMHVNGSRAFGVLFMRDLKNLIINPALVLFHTLFPMMLVWVLGYLTKSNYGGMGVTSYDFYGITLLLFSVLNVATTAANSFMEHNIKASNVRVLYSPIRPSFVYLSKIAATFVFTSVCMFGVIGLLHVSFGVRFGGDVFGHVAALVLLFNLLSSALGVMFCCVFRSEELTNKILSPVINVMALAGGLFFPVEGLSPAMERISWLSPVKWVAEAVFRIIYDHDVTLFLPVILVLSLAVVGAVVGCTLTFRTEDYV